MKIRDIAITVAVTMLGIHMAIISLIITIMGIVIATATIIYIILMGIIIEQRQRIDDNDEGNPRGLSFLLKKEEE